MSLIDSHVNLHADAFAGDLDAVLDRARARGVARMVTICDKLENFGAVLSVANREPDVFATVGAHPHYASDHTNMTADDLVARLQGNPKVVAIGETGLDQHYNFSPLEQQIAAFRAHIAAARTTGAPLIVHTREADALTGDILAEEHALGGFPILLHCYTSGAELLRRTLDLGGYVSFSGILTFKNAEDVRDRAREAPLDRIILETDCPYLAPVPFRGRRCEPAHVAEVYAAFAALRGLAMDDLVAIVASNFDRLFTRARLA